MLDVFFHNYINYRVPVFPYRFSWKMQCTITTKQDIVTIFVFRYQNTTKARKCIRYHINMLLNSLPLHITAKLYTHSQIGFVNYTKQLFLNGYTRICLVENGYVCRCVERNVRF